MPPRPVERVREQNSTPAKFCDEIAWRFCRDSGFECKWQPWGRRRRGWTGWLRKLTQSRSCWKIWNNHCTFLFEIWPNKNSRARMKKKTIICFNFFIPLPCIGSVRWWMRTKPVRIWHHGRPVYIYSVHLSWFSRLGVERNSIPQWYCETTWSERLMNTLYHDALRSWKKWSDVFISGVRMSTACCILLRL